jgi:hypothetical protein
VCFVGLFSTSWAENIFIFIFNSFSDKQTQPGIVSFTKYLSASAPSNRIDFVLKFQIGDAIESLQMELSSASDSEQEEDEEEEGDVVQQQPGKKQKY